MDSGKVASLNGVKFNQKKIKVETLRNNGSFTVQDKIYTNNGSFTVHNKTYSNKCWLIAFHDGLRILKIIDPKRFTIENLMNVASFMEQHEEFDTFKLAHIKGFEKMITLFPRVKVHVFISGNSYDTTPDPSVVFGEGDQIIRILNSPGHFEFIISEDSIFIGNKAEKVSSEEIRSQQSESFKHFQYIQQQRAAEVENEAYAHALEQEQQQEEESRVLANQRCADESLAYALQQQEEESRVLANQRLADEAYAHALEQQQEEEARILANQRLADEELARVQQQQEEEARVIALAKHHQRVDEAIARALQQQREEEARVRVIALAKHHQRVDEAIARALQQQHEEEARLRVIANYQRCVDEAIARALQQQIQQEEDARVLANQLRADAEYARVLEQQRKDEVNNLVFARSVYQEVNGVPFA